MNIVIFGHFAFPFGSASASRVRHISVGLTEQGHRVWVLTPLRGDPQPIRWLEYRGVAYYSIGGWLPKDPKTFANKLRTLRILFFGADSEAAVMLEKLHREIRVDRSIVYSGRCVGVQQALRSCRRLGIPVVRDVVEWFEPRSFPHGWLNPAYWDTYLKDHFSLPQADGIIAISRLIENRFRRMGKPVIRIPAIIDPNAWRQNGPLPSTGGAFQLTYLGDMSRRDGPFVMLDAIRRVVAQGHDVAFHIVGGVGRDRIALQARRTAERDPELSRRVRFWGRVSDEEVRERLFRSDALIFTRMPGRAAQAAFPTRLPEYLMTGRPVISSDVGDIGEYLTNGREIILVEPGSAAALADGIIRLLNMPDRGAAIGQAGLRRCQECFDYRARCAELSRFLEDLGATR